MQNSGSALEAVDHLLLAPDHRRPPRRLQKVHANGGELRERDEERQVVSDPCPDPVPAPRSVSRFTLRAMQRRAGNVRAITRPPHTRVRNKLTASLLCH